MADRAGEKLGWVLGFVGGFLWVPALSLGMLFQGATGRGVAGLLLTAAAVAVVLAVAPWRHPAAPYWKLMAPIYVLLAVAVAWGIWVAGGAGHLGISAWSLLLLLPVLLPFWLAGGHRWRDGGA